MAADDYDDDLPAWATQSGEPTIDDIVQMAADDGIELTPGDAAEEEAEDDNPEGRAAILTVIPTSTTNPARPRTIAAGYDSRTQTLSVLFRGDSGGSNEGQPYNYYGVSPREWQNFRGAISKGVFIRLYLDGKERGWAAIDSALYDQVVAYAEALQRIQKGVQTGQSPHSARRKRAVATVLFNQKADTLGVPKKSLARVLGYQHGNIGGTGRRRQDKQLDEAVASFYKNRSRP